MIDGSGNTVGGLSPASGNLISGNVGGGVVIQGEDAFDNTVEGDYIGTDSTGGTDGFSVPNGDYGVAIEISASGNTIGGTTTPARDVISGNGYNGVELGGTGTSGNVVEGDYIGTDVSGTVAVPNAQVGIEIDSGASGNTIGGTTTGASNVISGNAGVGIYLRDLDTTDNVVEGNDIGTDWTGTIPVPNGDGVFFAVGASNNTIGGTTAGARNVISGNESGGVEIYGTGATGNVILGNYIGTDVTGTVEVTNNDDGVEISGGATDNTIGGTTAGARNVISGGYLGIEIDGAGSSDNTVVGNYIGTDYTGTVAVAEGNGFGVGIDGGATGNTIGGTTAGDRNVISGNSGDGVEIINTGTSGNTVEGDYIGVDDTGTVAVANGAGVLIDFGATENTIGGTTAGAGDVISGSLTVGVQIAGAGTNGNVVQGNAVGLDAFGNALGNTTDGIDIVSGASGNTIGGTASGAGNVIANSILGNGVVVGSSVTDTANGDAILGNSIYSNKGLGIDLGDDGVTPNHSLPTTGLIAGAPNGDQNSPVIASATFVPDVSDSNGTLIVTGSLAADASNTYIIQVFANPAADPSGYGQGQTLIDSFDVSTDGITGNAVFSKSLATANLTGETISATATDLAGNTSEFAQDMSVASGQGSSITIPTDGGASATQVALQEAVSELQNLPAGSTPPPVLLQVTNTSELDSVIAAINGLTADAQPPIMVIVDLGGKMYQTDTPLNPPNGIDAMIQDGHLMGRSPALIVAGGIVTIDNVLATNATSTPTILVTGGSLTVRNSTIDGPPFTGLAAFSITGGTLDLGTTTSPGDNTINISMDTQFVQNATPTPVPTVGDTFNVSGTTQTATELSFTTLTGPMTSPPYGQSVTLNTSVVPDYPGDPAPSGSVYFLDETTGKTLGPAQLSGGVATFSTTALALGQNDLIALYSGNSRYLLSISAPITVTVVQPALLVTSIASVSPNLRNTSVGSIDVTFSEPVNLATFTGTALSLTDNGGSNLITVAVTVSAVSGSTSTYQINGLSGLTAAQGEYTLTVNSAEIQDQNGNAGSNSLSTHWLMDTTPPTGSISPLPERETTLVFPVTATGTDGGSPPSGIASFDIYTSTNGGKWTFWTNVPASSPTADFTGTSSTTYAFYSVAHDLAGNVQADKPFIEASTYVPDLIPPVTTVDATTGTNPSTLNNTTGTFTLNLTGSDPGGGLVTYFEVFVSIDGGTYQEVGPYAIPAGAPTARGTTIRRYLIRDSRTASRTPTPSSASGSTPPATSRAHLRAPMWFSRMRRLRFQATWR